MHKENCNLCKFPKIVVFFVVVFFDNYEVHMAFALYYKFSEAVQWLCGSRLVTKCDLIELDLRSTENSSLSYHAFENYMRIEIEHKPHEQLLKCFFAGWKLMVHTLLYVKNNFEDLLSPMIKKKWVWNAWEWVKDIFSWAV